MFFSFKQKDLSSTFNASVISRGITYAMQGNVRDVSVLSNNILQATVDGSENKPYKVKIEIIEKKDPKHPYSFKSQCTCPVAKSCKHAAAVLVDYINKPIAAKQALHQQEASKSDVKKALPIQTEETQLPGYIKSWLNALPDNVLKTAKPTPKSAPKKQLIYLLSNALDLQIGVSYYNCDVVRDGTYNANLHTTPRIPRANNLPQYMTQEDGRNLNLLSGRDFYAYSNDVMHAIAVDHWQALSMLQMICSTGRAFWRVPQQTRYHPDNALRWAEQRAATFAWQRLPNGAQKLILMFDNNVPVPRVLKTNPPVYVDVENHSMGTLMIDHLLPEHVQKLLSAPEIPAVHTKTVQAQLLKKAPVAAKQVPLPQVIENRRMKAKKFSVHLTLTTVPVKPRNTMFISNSQSIDMPAMHVAFHYDDAVVSFGQKDSMASILKDNHMIEFARDEKKEFNAIEKLKNSDTNFLPLQALDKILSYSSANEYAIVVNPRAEDMDDEWMYFITTELPEWQKDGWVVHTDENFPYQFVSPDEDSWYANVDDTPKNDWFDVQVGMRINGEQVSVLPMLFNALEDEEFGKMLESLKGKTDDMLKQYENMSISLPLPNSAKKVVLPITRVLRLFEFLEELNNTGAIDKNGQLRLQHYHAALLAEMENAAKAMKTRWFGGENLRQLGHKLRQFEGVSTVEPPKEFLASLRAYQQHGLNWLQFLREYNMSGILADDMGLGKTVQALAHICTEKAAGRLDKPVLIVAPTSLMINWGREAERFAPHLKVLTLHGIDRKQHFENISQYDMVLTTYPLLPRDKDVLLAQHFHSIILDEAQTIKNARAKLTQIVSQIKADHRLCMTGTPLENNLSEVWSLFHFLMPGYLGDEREFRRIFRTPIEKAGRADVAQALARRIKPFLLRRTKQEVATELPAKTEIVRMIDLDNAQRDLYEMIRINMHEKVREQIANKGLSKSHIVVLDALLKLRQTCCDPRLLKVASAKKVTESAKLDTLMEMVPDMVQEGRKILIFSQFTSMLSLIEERLRAEKISYVILTGDTTERATPITAFQNGTVPVFLLSLKAGGVGLNLTAADTVIHYDPWWNPAVEQQATDRAYRIGQDKPVFVYKLVTQGTVEEKILHMQARKQALADSLFNPENSQKSALTTTDIEALFEPLSGDKQLKLQNEVAAV